MKKLIFVRHGKAEDISPELTDAERSLTNRGKTTSRMMARKLKEKENYPGLIVTSPAFRALETALIFADEYGIIPSGIILDSNLYFKMSFNYLTELLSGISPDIDTVTLFGHNPSFTDIADTLCNGGCDLIPKSGVVGISFDVSDWKAIRRHKGKTDYYLKS